MINPRNKEGYMNILAKLIPAGVLAAGLPLLASTAASASQAAQPAVSPHSITAITAMLNRDDSGGNGNWAKDSFVRVLTVTQQKATVPLADCSPTATVCYAFTASLKDAGSFRTISGAYTPNQGGADAGEHIRGVVQGQMLGAGDFATFYATALPSARLVPLFNTGDANPSYLWPELAFPAGTVFSGLNEDPWGYSYTAKVQTGVRGHSVVQTQRWADTSDLANDGGQGPTAGNITG
jgi:hypothetical protein